MRRPEHPTSKLVISILAIALAGIGVACQSDRSTEHAREGAGDHSVSQGQGPGVLLRQKQPSHQIVCSCRCESVPNDPDPSPETHQPPTRGSCVDYDNIKCTKKDGTKGRLRGCTRESVPNAAQSVLDGLSIELAPIS